VGAEDHHFQQSRDSSRDGLARARTVDDVLVILKTAFQGNDYDGFELSFTPEWPPSYGAAQMISPFQYVWRSQEEKGSKGWELRLDLLPERERFAAVFLSFEVTQSPHSAVMSIASLQSLRGP
jgi:hypothetical protein